MKVLVIFLLAATVLAAPQHDTLEDDDVEIVAAPRAPPRDPEGVLFFFPGLGNVRNLFPSIFSNQPRFPDVASDDDFSENFPSDPTSRTSGFFSSIFRSFFDFPRPSENSTVTFSNSSTEVVNIGGVPMLVNRTLEERTGDDGSVYFKVEQRLVGPYNATNSTSESTTASSFSTSTISNTTSTTPPSTGLKHALRKRWIVSLLKNAFGRRKSDSSRSQHNHLHQPRDKDARHGQSGKEAEAVPGLHNNLVPIRRDGDIAVNYLGVPRTHDPDAEVFDVELLRETERRFSEGRINPVVSQPFRSQSLRSQPLRSQPLRYQL